MAFKSLLTLLVGADTSKMNTSLKKGEKQLGAFGRSAKGLNAIIGRLGGAFALISIGRDATRRIVAFDKAMIGLSAILRTTRSEIEDLEKQAIKLGSATIYTATQIGELQTILARFGFDQTEIENSTAAILDLAAAAGIDLAIASDAAASTLRAFGLDTTEMRRVVDVMASSFTRSALTVETYAEAMKYAAPLAAAAGTSIEETSAMLALLADNGLRGSLAGTSLRRIFVELAKSGKSMTEIFQEAGGSTDFLADALGFADDAVGKYALSSFIILAKNADLIEKNTKAFGEFGVASQVADTQLGSLSAKVTILNSAWERFILTLESGEGVIATFFAAGISGATELLNILSDVDNTINGSGFNDLELRRLDQAGQGVGQYDASNLKDPFDDWMTVEDWKERKKVLGEANDHFQAYLDLVNGGLGEVNAKQETYNENVAEQEAFLNKILNTTKKANAKKFEDLDKLAKAEETAQKEQDRLQKLAHKQQLEVNRQVEIEVALWDKAKNAYVSYIQTRSMGMDPLVSKPEDQIQSGDGTGAGIVTTPTFVDWDKMYDDATADALIAKNEEIGESFLALSTMIGFSLARGAANWEEYSQNLGEIVLDIAGNYALAAASAAAANAVESTSSIPWGFLLAPAAVGLALGIVKTAMSGAKSTSTTAFAEGGVISGPVSGYQLLGEYSGASTNPEVVAPLSKLRGMISDLGMGGNVNVSGEFVLQNRVLVAALNRENERSNQYGA